jgi:hypothetical protein
VYIGLVDPGYVVKGVDDFDVNHKADIVWHHATRGEVWIWLMDGTTRLNEVWVGTVPDMGYQIVGVADHTGDRKADILWHHATRGEVWIWMMSGTTRLAATWVDTVPDTGYRIVGSGDYDGDGRADVLWHHATRGEVWVWLMCWDRARCGLPDRQVGSCRDPKRRAACAPRLAISWDFGGAIDKCPSGHQIDAWTRMSAAVAQGRPLASRLTLPLQFRLRRRRAHRKRGGGIPPWQYDPPQCAVGLRPVAAEFPKPYPSHDLWPAVPTGTGPRPPRMSVAFRRA